MSAVLKKVNWYDHECAFCIPLPGTSQTLPNDRMPVPGYSMTDPDGHQWFAVSTRYAGTFGENLQFIHEPDELNDAS